MSQDHLDREPHKHLTSSGQGEASEEASEASQTAPLEPQGFEPASIDAVSAPVAERSTIKPKLIKRDMGVRLTEVRRAPGRSGGARAPRGTGPLVEGPATEHLRRARAIKRATELISYVSEDHDKAELSKRVADSFGRHHSAPTTRPEEAATAPPQSSEERQPAEGSKPKSRWSRWSLAPKSAPVEIDSQDLSPEPQVEEIDWELDEETLNAMNSASEEVSLGGFERPGIGSVNEEVNSADSSGASPTAEADHSLSPSLFTEHLRAFHDEGTPLDEPRGAGALVNSHHASNQKKPNVDRGYILWSAQRADSSGNELSANALSSHVSANEPRQTRRGWRLERLQNRVEGAETWIGVELNDQAVQRSAVIKLVWPHLLSDNPMMWQFDAEIQVRALQQVDHVTIPKILDWGEHTELNAWFTVLEWVEGDSLAHHLKRTPLTTEDAIALFSKLSEGLALCHQEGLIHRKIQPAHIILSPRGPSFISFQWVDEVAGRDLQRAQQGAYQLFGRRPKFLAPEWMQDAMITDAADIYALGACLLESVNTEAKGWRDAPPKLHACLAGALHAHPDERSDISEFARDLDLSSAHYLYQAGQNTGSAPQSLPLHEVIARLRSSELGWHLLGRESNRSGEFEELAPWGEFAEVVSALERAKRYQSELNMSAPQESEDLSLKRDELERRSEALQRREDDLKKREEELQWRDEALRARERELNERDAALQEEATRLERFNAELDAQEEALQGRREQLEASEGELQSLRDELSARSDELESRSASLRVEESEIARREAERAEEIALLQASLESERQRLLTEDREERASEKARIQEQARLLIEKREAELKAARAAEEEARAEAEERARALAEADRARALEREEYERELMSRTSERHAREDAEGAFVRSELRRVAPSVESPPPDELTHREFEVGGVTLRARYCPPGSTWCGSDEEGARAEERPRHRAMISQGFWLMETPVTQAQWSTLMEENPSTTTGLDHPVEGVTWVEAALFCNALSEAFKFDPAYEFDGDVNFSRHRTRVHWRYRANGFRLPTELEWEYAARSGLSGQRHHHPLGEELDEVGWYAQNSQGTTHPVGLKRPNQWGLYDLSGNVWEWCHDEWRRESYRQRAQDGARDSVAYNPQLTPRVIRGGAWYDFKSACRLAARPGQDINQSYGIGLRLCLPHPKA